MERILDVKMDGTKLLVTESNSFTKCQYRDPKPNEEVALGEDDIMVAVLRSCHGMACATAGLGRPNAREWTRLSRNVSVV